MTIPEGVKLKKVTEAQFIVAFERTWIECDSEESRYGTFLTDSEPDDEHICLGTVTTTYEIPDDDRYMDEQSIIALKAQRTALVAKRVKECQEIDDKIQKLTAIEHMPWETT